MGWLDFLFPKTCISCNRYGSYLCADCVNHFKPIDKPVCPMCHKPNFYGKTHTRCSKPLGMDGLISSFPYYGAAKRMVAKYKYRLVTDLTPLLIDTIVSFTDLTPLESHPWVVVGVPLHPKRYRWRGFNQADTLGKHLAQYFNWPFHTEVLNRIKYTPPQIQLSGQHRRQNVVGAFSKGKNIDNINQQHVLLIDDVWTTGATMRECTKILKRSGAKQVWGLTIARTV